MFGKLFSPPKGKGKKKPLEPVADKNLTRQNLDGHDFRHKDLGGASLNGAHCRKTKFWGANLAGADFRGADIRGATFWGARLQGANFDGAIFNGETRFSRPFKISGKGMQYQE